MAPTGGEEQTEPVPVSSYPFFEGPFIAVAALGVIVLICRWVFATDRPASTGPAGPADYGLLEPVTVVRTREDAQMLRELLLQAGIRGTVVGADGGYALLVFTGDAGRARALVRA